MKQRVTIHIGYGRTGTTWLQNAVFSRLEDVDYLGKTRNDYPKWLMEWSYLDRFLFQERLTEFRSRLSHSQAQQLLISSEAFTQSGSIFEQLDRIQRVVRRPKLLMVIRNPVDLVISKYRYLVSAGLMHGSLADNLDYSQTPFDLVRRKRLYLYDYNFPTIIRGIRSTYRDCELKVLKYELLQRDAPRFVNEVVSFVGGNFNHPHLDLRRVNESRDVGNIDPSTIDDLRSFFGDMAEYHALPEID